MAIRKPRFVKGFARVTVTITREQYNDLKYAFRRQFSDRTLAQRIESCFKEGLDIAVEQETEIRTGRKQGGEDWS